MPGKPRPDTSHPDTTRPDDSRPDRLALLAAAVTVLLWASAFVVIRGVAGDFAPGPLALGRLLVGAVALGIVLAVRRRPLRLPRGRAVLPVIVYGVAWFAGYNVALNAGERHLDAGTSAMLVNVGPIIVAVLAGVLLHEGFPRPLLVGSAIALTGAVVISLGAAGGRHSDLLGVLLVLASAVLYAVGITAQKPALVHTPALTATWLGCVIGAVVCLPFLGRLVSQASHASGATIVGIVYLGVGPTALAFTTWAYALARTTAGRQGATTYVVPVIAVLIAWPALGETPPVLSLVGGALCLVGVAATRRRARRTVRARDVGRLDEEAHRART